MRRQLRVLVPFQEVLQQNRDIPTYCVVQGGAVLPGLGVTVATATAGHILWHPLVARVVGVVAEMRDYFDVVKRVHRGWFDCRSVVVTLVF